MCARCRKDEKTVLTHGGGLAKDHHSLSGKGGRAFSYYVSQPFDLAKLSEDEAFYGGKLATAEFFFARLLLRTLKLVS